LILIVIFEHLFIEFHQVAMNHWLRWMIMGLLVVAYAWSTQPVALYDTETSSPNLLTVQELDVKLEELVDQPETYINNMDKPTTTAYPYHDSSPIEESSWTQLVSKKPSGELSGPRKRDTDIKSLLGSDPIHWIWYIFLFCMGILLAICVIISMLVTPIAWEATKYDGN
jgi:hypothetical protein